MRTGGDRRRVSCLTAVAHRHARRRSDAVSHAEASRASIRTIRCGATTIRVADAEGRRASSSSTTTTTFSRTPSARPAIARRSVPLNVNTLDEVPDSSWFENRIGRREMPIAEMVKGPDRDIKFGDAWTITRGKNRGFQPGFRAFDRSDPAKDHFQLEFDPPRNPEMATAAETVGTAFYHAFGYHVVDVYILEIDPAKLEICRGCHHPRLERPPPVRARRSRGDDEELGEAAERPRPRHRRAGSSKASTSANSNTTARVRRPQRHLSARAPARAARQPGVRRVAESRRLARGQHAGDAARAQREETISSTTCSTSDRSSAARRGFRDPPQSGREYTDRQRTGAADAGDARVLGAAVAVRRLSRRAAIGRALHRRQVRSREVGRGVSEGRLREHAARRRVLGRADRGEVLRRGDSRDGRERASTPIRRRSR